MSDETTQEFELTEGMLSSLFAGNDLNTPWPPTLMYYGPDTRSIVIVGEVNDAMATHVNGQLLELESLSATEPVYIHLNTEGGSVFDAYSMYDTMRSVSNPVVVIVRGLCASAGMLLLAGADVRLASPNAKFYYHQVQLTESHIGSLEKMQSIANLYTHLNDELDAVVKRRCNMTDAVWDAEFKNKTDKWFSAQEALKFNVVDHVLPNKKKSGFTVDYTTGEITIPEES